MSMAIQYAMQKRAKKMAKGGDVKGVHMPMDNHDRRGKSDPGEYSDAAHYIRRTGQFGNASEENAQEYEAKAKKQHAEKLHEMRSMKKPNLYAEGGACEAHGTPMCEMCHGGEYAKGGDAEDYRLEGGMHKSGMKNGGKSLSGIDVRQARGVREKDNKVAYPESVAKFYEESAKDVHRKALHQLKNANVKHAMNSQSKDIRELPEKYAEGGAVEEDDRMLNQHGEEEVGAMDMEEDNEPQHERMVSHPLENQSDHEDMVGRIMRQRMKHFSKGGQVANDTPITADFEDNQFDDLVKDDELEHHYTGANSGDEIGDEQEDEDRRDIVSRIMKSRRLKDRLPHPA